MEKITTKIMRINFAKRLKQLIIAVLCVAVLGGGASAFLLRGQIGEVITSVQSWHENEDGNQAGTEGAVTDNREYWKEEHHKDDILENIHITEPSAAAKAAVGITGLFCALSATIYWLLISAWLYKSAVLSGMNGFLWFLLGLCGNLLAAILFYLVRSFLREKCSSCGHYSLKSAKYCHECGKALVEECPECGETVCKNDKFCPSCGKQIPKH